MRWLEQIRLSKIVIFGISNFEPSVSTAVKISDNIL